MCDYSLGGIPNRLAIEGEELEVHRFRTGAMGMASPADLRAAKPEKEPHTFWERIKVVILGPPQCVAPAVCISPGTRLLLQSVPAKIERQFHMREGDSVVFTQTSLWENTFRDALELPDGRVVSLQDLREGMRLKLAFLGPVNRAEEASTDDSLVSHR
jgi:hypothetical protein